MDKKIAYERALFAFWAETLQKIVPDDLAAAHRMLDEELDAAARGAISFTSYRFKNVLKKRKKNKKDVVRMSEKEAAEIWTNWVQNELAAKYPHAAGYRVEAAGERVRVLDEAGNVRGEWDERETDFVGHLLVAIDPTLEREGFWAKLKRRFSK